MYEATVSVPKEHEYILDYIKNQMSGDIAAMDAIASELTEGSRSSFAIACSDTFRFQMKRVLVNNVSLALVMGYKNLFIRNCLNVENADFFQNTLMNTMCVFDREFDKQAVEKVLNVDKPMCLDGYFNFKLRALRGKWQEIVGLVSQNGYILRDARLITEFLQYLLDSIACKVSELTVSFEDNGFLLYDSKNNILPPLRFLAGPSSAEEQAAINIILLKPKCLIVICDESPSNEFCEFLKLFDHKIITVG